MERLLRQRLPPTTRLQLPNVTDRLLLGKLGASQEVEEPIPCRRSVRVRSQIPMDQPDRPEIFHVGVDAVLREEERSEGRWSERLASGRLDSFDRRDHARLSGPEPDRSHHVLADAESNHRVGLSEAIRLGPAEPHSFRKPTKTQRKTLVPRKSGANAVFLDDAMRVHPGILRQRATGWKGPRSSRRGAGTSIAVGLCPCGADGQAPAILAAGFCRVTLR